MSSKTARHLGPIGIYAVVLPPCVIDVGLVLQETLLLPPLLALVLLECTFY